MKQSYLFSLMVIVTVMTSCELLDPDARERKEKEKEYRNAWTENVCEIDRDQTWNTANNTRIIVSVAESSTISVYTLGQQKRTLLGRATDVTTSDFVYVDIPQGIGEMIAVCCSSASGDTYQSISVDEVLQGGARVSFVESQQDAMTTKAPMSDETRLTLSGCTEVDPRTSQRAKIYGYTEFPGWIWTDLSKAMPENKTAVGQVNNFELQSNGIFYISTIYGVTGNMTAKVGYYYYDKNTPEDITYVPLIDALAYDYYYDGQTILSKESAKEKTLWKNKETGLWSAANYDAYDKTGGYTSSKVGKIRANDDQLNVLEIQNKYGNDDESKNKIAAVKGLTFQIDAPKGNMVGFYVERNDGGIFRNHTTASMNLNKAHNAIIKVYDGFRFIGLEDTKKVDESRRDCNDIAFVMVPGNDGTLPGLLLPYIKDITEDKYYNADGTWTESPKYDEATDGRKTDGTSQNLSSMKQTWTFGFEDMGVVGDFDFNDVVFRVTPDTESHTAEILLCATGGGLQADLYYKNDKIGEVHELLGSSGVTNTNKISITPKVIANVSWPESNCMEKNAKDFYIKVNGEKIAIPSANGEVPKAICVAGEWQWPRESVNISEAYPEFGEWGANYSEKSYWDWYCKPAEGKTIGYSTSD